MNNIDKPNASHAMDTSPTTLKATDTIMYAANIIMHSRYRNLPVVDDDFCYQGIFGVNSLLKQVIPSEVFLPNGLSNVGFIHESFEEIYQRFASVKEQPIASYIDTEIQSVTPETSLTEVMLQLYNTRASIPVVEPGSCKLMGMISYWEIGEKILAAGGLTSVAPESSRDSDNA